MANAVMAIHAFLVVKIILSQSHSVRRFIILFIIIYHLFIIIYSLSFIICYRLQRYCFFRYSPN